MLTIAKLGEGRARYYLATVAAGIEDYYAGHGEAPGTWRGAGARQLGLDGVVDGELLEGLLCGQLPGAESPVRGGKRTPGWDLTFAAPKSVSVLFGVAAPAVASEVVAAHETAVAAGLDYLERWALQSRRRVDGEVVHEVGEGMIVAGFRHRTSRALDPQLHTHALVVNLTRHGGGWGAIDSRPIYKQAKTAGSVYQAVLRSELTMRLGVRWGDVNDNGFAELAAVPEAARELFSKRHDDIERHLDERGLSSLEAARIAGRRTRATKQHVAGNDALRERWRAEAAEHGIDLQQVERGLSDIDGREVRDRVSRRERRLATAEMVGAAGLTEQRTSFQRSDVAQAWCRRIDPHTRHVNVDMIDELVNDTLADPNMVVLGLDEPTRGTDRRRWSTRDMLAVEARVLERVADGRDQHIAVVPQRTINTTLRRHSTLSDEQAAMIRALTGDGHRIDAIVGVAGSGKTYAMKIANELWRDAGHRVIGVAVAKKAAQQLQADSGIPTWTLDSLLMQLAQPSSDGLAAGSVLVVDETGMVPTRKLDQLLHHCGPDIKVVLVGDHRQLPEIDAGGVLRAIVERYPIVTLNENRRQHDVDERVALSELRDGNVGRGLDWYIGNNRVSEHADSAGARQAMIDTWWHDRQHGATDQLLMAERRVDVARLNQLARHRLADAGELDLEHAVEIGEHAWAAGDQVLFLKNDRKHRFANGTRGTVTGVDPDRHVLYVDVAGTEHEVPEDYITNGHLDFAYAATVHKNQGSTCDHAYLLASDAIYRELGYVALSRGRIDNRIWTITDTDIDPATPESHGAANEPTDPLAELRHSMSRSQAQQLATDLADELEPAGIDL